MEIEQCKKGHSNILLGKYELGRLLGQGTFAKVYYARNLKTGESVAIKVIDKTKIEKGGMMDQIKREISIMKLVRHPNIAKLYEVMASKSRVYFVLEYVRGGELFHKVAKGKLREETARRYFQQMISAVDFCHSRGVYHRDLKPENLLVDGQGSLKVSDFGLSALPQQFRQDGLLHTTCGTPAYVAPEVILRKGYDGAGADVWSCGVILFVLMAGYLPFHDANLMAMYKKVYKGEFKCPPWFSPDVRRILSRLLDPNPRTRITIARLLEIPWFKKGYKWQQVYHEEHCLEDVDMAFNECFSDSRDLDPGLKPTCLNAFDIISQSPGFNLSGLFENKGTFSHETRFTSRQPVSTIISKLQEIAKVFRFSIKKKDFKVKLEGSEVGRKGRVAIAAEIFELTSSLFIVELRKVGGDTLEYHKFCKQELRPGLKDIVWTWQDETQ
eukprot:Gb_16900 [translate_table: standard]